MEVQLKQFNSLAFKNIFLKLRFSFASFLDKECLMSHHRTDPMLMSTVCKKYKLLQSHIYSCGQRLTPMMKESNIMSAIWFPVDSMSQTGKAEMNAMDKK